MTSASPGYLGFDITTAIIPLSQTRRLGGITPRTSFTAIQLGWANLDTTATSPSCKPDSSAAQSRYKRHHALSQTRVNLINTTPLHTRHTSYSRMEVWTNRSGVDDGIVYKRACRCKKFESCNLHARCAQYLLHAYICILPVSYVHSRWYPAQSYGSKDYFYRCECLFRLHPKKVPLTLLSPLLYGATVDSDLPRHATALFHKSFRSKTAVSLQNGCARDSYSTNQYTVIRDILSAQVVKYRRSL
ncbi:hypothetical protein BD779DRAFT_346059 [Infundibulicybe gibba]|nr:hypothetical protein BD779DRAFT_346059 [Infundibulicybe gibba]